MHITPPRVLGMLMFLGLIGYAFFLAPWLNTRPAHGPAAPAAAVTAPAAHAPATSAPHLSPRAPLSRAE